MRLTVENLRERLRLSGRAIAALAERTDARQARWKPTPERWSVLEVVNHLADEEAEDFRQRLRLVLSDPTQPWPPIDPPRAAVERKYNERDLGESLRHFQGEREESIAWLSALPEPVWSVAHEHPQMGPMTAGVIAASWMAHDLLHIRQLAKLHYDFVAAGEFAVEYAGKW